VVDSAARTTVMKPNTARATIAATDQARIHDESLCGIPGVPGTSGSNHATNTSARDGNHTFQPHRLVGY
jgi:hypothetical protein